MLKKEMVDLIVATLYNISEITGPVMMRTHRGYMRWSKEDLQSDYNKAVKINYDTKLAAEKKAYKDAAAHHAKVVAKANAKEKDLGAKNKRAYKALDHNGHPIITVLAGNAYLARGEVLEQLSRNPSRRPYKDTWRKGHCTLLTDTGIKLYWCHNMERFVTIPNGGDDA